MTDQWLPLSIVTKTQAIKVRSPLYGHLQPRYVSGKITISVESNEAELEFPKANGIILATLIRRMAFPFSLKN